MLKLKTLFYLFVISIFMEGVFRKWVFPSSSGTIWYSVKYVILLLICINLIVIKKRIYVIHKPIFSYIVIYFILVIFSTLVTTQFNNGSLVAIIALIQYLSPLILISAIPVVFNNKERVVKFINIMGIIAIPLFVLAFIQYASPSTSLINRYPTAKFDYVAMVGNSVRVTSVFSYITPFGDFTLFVLIFCLCYLSKLRDLVLTTSKKTMILMLLSFSILGGFMTGARLVVGLEFLYIFVYMLYEVYRVQINRLLFYSILIVGIIIYYETFGIQAFDNFVHRVSTSSDSFSSRTGKMLEVGHWLQYSGFFGNGAGFACNSLQGLLTFKSPIYFEEELGRIILEFGIIGCAVITFVRFSIYYYMIRIYLSINDLELKCISLSTIIGITMMTFYLQLCIYNWFTYLFYFILIGINLSIYRCERKEADF